MPLFLYNFLLYFLYVLFIIKLHFSFYYKACSWNIGFLQVVSISKLHHMFKSNHRMFYMQSFLVLFLYKFLVLEIQTLLFYSKCVENGYFSLPSKFEMKVHSWRSSTFQWIKEKLAISSWQNRFIQRVCPKKKLKANC